MSKLPGRIRVPLASSFFWCAAMIAPGGAPAFAQTPPPPPPLPPNPVHASVELHLQSLQAISGAGVYAIQNLQTGGQRSQDPVPTPRPEASEGSKAARLLAHVRDARFDGEGRLLALLIEPPVPDPRSEEIVRVLPAAAVRWDEPLHHWVVIEPNLQFGELEAVNVQKPAASPPTGQPLPPTVWLASQLVQASFDPILAVVPAPPEARQKTVGQPVVSAAPTPAPVIWMAPTLQRLVLAVVPITVPVVDGPSTTRHVPVPWSLVSTVKARSGCHLRFTATPVSMAAGPDAVDAMERPSALLRQRCYEHFGLATPSWEAAASKPTVVPK